MTNKLLLGVIILMELAILGAVVYLKFFRHWSWALDPGPPGIIYICLHWLFSSNNAVLLYPANCFCECKQGNDSVLKRTLTDRQFCPRTGEAHFDKNNVLLDLLMDRDHSHCMDKLWIEICTICSDCYCQWWGFPGLVCWMLQIPEVILWF